MNKGKISMYNSEFGYGLIITEDNKSFSFINVHNEDFNQNDNVTFEIIEEEKNSFATNIQKIDSINKKSQQNKIKLYILDYNEQFIKKIISELEELNLFEVVGSLSDGKNAIEEIDKLLDVDVLIINLVLPNLDGLAILKHLSKKQPSIFKKIIASSFFVTSDLMDVLRELNVVYFMMYPYTVENIIEVLNTFLPNTQKRENEMMKKLDYEITKLFIDLGVPANLRAYDYLKTAIIECIDNYSKINDKYLIEELYPMIGLKYDCSGMSVERSMRTAIRIAVERGNSKTLGNLFGHTISIYKDNPTNSEFIFTITKKLHLKLYESGDDVQNIRICQMKI